MDIEVIGVDADGLVKDVGEGIFGYGTPDGSLGRSAFTPPKVFANRRRQGIFFTPYSYKGYEAAEPEMRWALERRPGLPLFPGSSARGLVLIGPAMGEAPTNGLGTLGLLAVGFLVGVGAYHFMGDGR